MTDKKFFKNAQGKLFIDPIESNHEGLVNIIEQEYDELLAAKNTPPLPTLEQQRQTAMQTGVGFEGVMCSAFKEDQWGLDSVKDYIRDGVDIGDFLFKNGSTLNINQSNIDAFEAVWLPFRIAHTKSNFIGS